MAVQYIGTNGEGVVFYAMNGASVPATFPAATTTLQAGTTLVDVSSGQRWLLGAIGGGVRIWQRIDSGAISSSPVIHWNSATGVDTNPGTATLPVQTMQGIIDAMPSTWEGTLRVQDDTPGGGTLLWVGDGGMTYFPVPKGRSNNPIVFLPNAWGDAGPGTLTVATTTTTTINGRTCTRINLVGTPLVAGAWKGRTIQVITSGVGVQVGTGVTVMTNGTGTIDCVGSFTVANGATLQIQLSNTTIQLLSGAGFHPIAIASGNVFVAGHIVKTNASTPDLWVLPGAELTFYACEVSLWNGAAGTRGRLRNLGGTLTFNSSPSPVRVPDLTSIVTPAGLPTSAGNWIHDCGGSTGGIWVGFAGEMQIATARVDSCPMLLVNGAVYRFNLLQTEPSATPAMLVTSLQPGTFGDAGPCQFTEQLTGIAPAAGGVGIDIEGATYDIETVDISTAGDGVIITQSRGRVVALTGTGGTRGFTASQMSSANVTDPNVGTTIAGSSYAVKVGANTGDTWANIAAAASSHTTDVAAGSSGVAASQICRVGA